MEDLLKFGLVNRAFTAEQVMDLLYGELKYSSHTAVKTNQRETFCEWLVHPRSYNDWRIIPVEQRKEIIALIMETIKNDYNDFDCFHIRILCLLHFLLDDEENEVECFADYPRGASTSTKRKYYAFLSPTQERIAPFEMFLWFQAGLKKTQEERRLFRMLRKKFLGCDNVRSRKLLKELAEKKIAEFEAKYKSATRNVRYNESLIKKRYCEEREAIKKGHFTKAKRELLLKQLQRKDSSARIRFWYWQGEQMQCVLVINFLNGYLDSLKLSGQ
jgi:hypothetical protein